MTTNKEDIRRLLDLYMEGKTSLEEEALLMEYFRSPDADKDFADFKTMFNQFDEGEPSFTEEEQERWMQSCPPEAAPDSSGTSEAHTLYKTNLHTVDSGRLHRSRMFFLRNHRLAKGSYTAYKFHLHAPYRPHGSKVENRYGIHRKASAHYVDRQNNHNSGHNYPSCKPPKRTNVDSPPYGGEHIYHQNGLNTPTRHRPTRRRHGNPTTGHATLGRHSGRVPKAEKKNGRILQTI